jgi:DDE superfamily endonuclease
LEDRKQGWPWKALSGIIDTFTCEVLQPQEESWEFCRSPNHFTVKYEIVRQLGCLELFGSPVLGKELGLTQLLLLSGIKEMLGGEETLLADKGYRGEDNKISFICPTSGHRSVLPKGTNAYKYIVYSAPQSIERVIRRMRIFTILYMRWRFSLALHALVVKVLGKIVNLIFLFEPQVK